MKRTMQSRSFRATLVLVGTLALALNAAWSSSVQALATHMGANWYGSMPLAQQVDWSEPIGSDQADLLRKSYILGELSNRVYEDTAAKRGVTKLGFRELDFKDRSRTLSWRDVETIVRGSSGDFGGALAGTAPLSDKFYSATELVVAAPSGAKVVALRGSFDVPDVITDLNAGTVVYKGATYHHGFFVYAKLVFDDIRAQLSEACTEPVWITGHSLGGAAANVIALFLKRSGCNVKGVVTFAAPRFGQANALQDYKDEGLNTLTQRWINKGDPVACLPLGPRWKAPGQQHLIDENIIDLDDDSDVCDGEGEGIASDIYAWLLKVHNDWANPTIPFLDWLEGLMDKTQICDLDPTERVLLGLFTGFASEGVCKSIDEVTDQLAIADQFQRLVQLIFAYKTPDKHSMETAYLYVISEDYSFNALDLFCQGLWRPRMEELGTLGYCGDRPGH